MKVVNGKVEKSIVIISENTSLIGMIVGDVIVDKNIIFEISGMVIGNLELKSNSYVTLHGVLTGDVLKVDDDAKLDIFGKIDGRIHCENTNIFIDKDAIINN